MNHSLGKDARESAKEGKDDKEINVIWFYVDGTAGNIESISHCATRVCIVPKNSKRMNKLEETDLMKGSLYI